MLSFSLVAEALTGLIYHRTSGENSKFLPEVFESTLEAALSSEEVPELKSAQDIDKYADLIITAISTAVDKAIPTSESWCPEGQPVLKESLALIKEKRRLMRQYSQALDPLVKTCINKKPQGASWVAVRGVCEICWSSLLSYSDEK